MFGRLSAFERCRGEAMFIGPGGSMRGARASTGAHAWASPNSGHPGSRAAAIRDPQRWRVSCVPALPSLRPGRLGGRDGSPPALVEEIVYRARGRGVDAGRLDEVVVGGALDRLHGAEMMQEGALAVGADAGDLVEGALRHLALALRPVRADREPVGLVAQALH